MKERGQKEFKEFKGKIKLSGTKSPEHVPWNDG